MRRASGAAAACAFVAGTAAAHPVTVPFDYSRGVIEIEAEAPIREHVAGVSEAHRRHGGEGALYVALKRKRQ